MKKLLLLIFVLSVLTTTLSYAKEETDYYKILGVKRGATEDQIKKAFKKLAVRFHPDKNQDNPEEAKIKFQKIANAYETLSDPEKRRIYDQLGEEGVKRQAQGGGGAGPGAGFQAGFNVDDIFKQFFGGGGVGA
jgi:DnaJ-class molecular chaperone